MSKSDDGEDAYYVFDWMSLRCMKQYSNIYVYAYNVLPCVDAVIDAIGSSSVVGIIYND